MSDVEAGLADLAQQAHRLKINSIAIPQLGCGLDGLDWNDVRPWIERAFADAPVIRVLLFAPLPCCVNAATS